LDVRQCNWIFLDFRTTDDLHEILLDFKNGGEYTLLSAAGITQKDFHGSAWIDGTKLCRPQERE
jgi:hypothetical protein